MSEISRSLQLDEKLREKWQHIDFLLEGQSQHKKEIENLKYEMFAVDQKIEELDAALEVCECTSTEAT